MDDHRLRILSYNVRYFGHALRGLASTQASMTGIGRAVAAFDPPPDVICLQEIETQSLRSLVAHRDPRAVVERGTQLERFMRVLGRAYRAAGRALPYEAFYFPAHVVALGKVPIYTTGLAILVRLGTLRVGTHNVTSPERITYHRVERWKDRKQTRICAHMTVTTPAGRVLHLFNTHLSLPSPFDAAFWSRRERMGWGANQLHEARALAGFVHRTANGDPFVVCGDFNSPPGSPVYRFLCAEAGFDGAQERCCQIEPANPRGFATAGFLHLRMHLDHLFAGNGLAWLDVEGTHSFDDRTNPFRGLSDHVPLLGRVRC